MRPKKNERRKTEEERRRRLLSETSLRLAALETQLRLYEIKRSGGSWKQR
jgi:hypothetical protein